MSNTRLSEWQGTFSRIAPAGCYVGLHLGFYSPLEELNTFPPAWVDEYTVRGLALYDPLMHWAFGNEGTVRWSDLAAHDNDDIFGSYSEHGMRYGTAVSILGNERQPRRSFGFFARIDKEFEDAEMAELQVALSTIHNADQEKSRLTDAQVEALRLLSNGLRQKEIAYELGISESAVKARLKSAIIRMGARTAAQAASIAEKKGFL